MNLIFRGPVDIVGGAFAEWGFMMSKFEKKLCLAALVFVAVYLGAAVYTLHSRIAGKSATVQRIESEQVSPAEGRLLLVELFLPMAILLTLTVSYIVVRKTRAKKALRLDEPDEDDTAGG